MNTRVRIFIEQFLAVFIGGLGLLTLFWRDWIEWLVGWDPDHHSGFAEWLIVAALLVAAIGFGWSARTHRGQLRAQVQHATS